MNQPAETRSHVGADGDRVQSSWPAMHGVDVVFAALVGAVFVYLLRATSGAFFQGDDWRLILEGGSLGGILSPYNDHLSVTILAIYRGLVEIFGFSYLPFQVVGLLSLMAVPVAYYVTTRNALGSSLAAAAALSMLAFGNIELNPAVLNHYLVLVGAILCAAALNRGAHADWLLLAALLLALSAAGGGLAVAGACLVHNLCVRPPARRWLVVLGPCLLWVAWWAAVGRTEPSQFRPAERPTTAEALRYATRVLWTPFEHLGVGNTVLVLAWAMLFVACGAWRLRVGLAGAANFLAWSAALTIWAAGLAYGRGDRGITRFAFRQEVFFRYQLLALGFVLLAIVPKVPNSWPVRWPRRLAATRGHWQVAAALAILSGAVLGAVTLKNDVDATATRLKLSGRTTKAELLVLDLGAVITPDDVTMTLRFFGLSAGEVRSLLDRYGHSQHSTISTVDRELVDMGAVSARSASRRDLECLPLSEPVTWASSPTRPPFLWSDHGPVTVAVRLFGDEWIEIFTLGADQAVRLNLPVIPGDHLWQVRANGACRRAD